MLYEQRMKVELEAWQHKMCHQPSLMDRLSKSVQSRINRIIPQQVHDAITVTIKQMVRGVLFGSTYTVPSTPVFASLYDLEEAVLRRVDFYRKTAAAEGVLPAQAVFYGVSQIFRYCLV